MWKDTVLLQLVLNHRDSNPTTWLMRHPITQRQGKEAYGLTDTCLTPGFLLGGGLAEVLLLLAKRDLADAGEEHRAQEYITKGNGFHTRISLTFSVIMTAGPCSKLSLTCILYNSQLPEITSNSLTHTHSLCLTFTEVFVSGLSKKTACCF